jgi:hypothetical protein
MFYFVVTTRDEKAAAFGIGIERGKITGDWD